MKQCYVDVKIKKNFRFFLFYFILFYINCNLFNLYLSSFFTSLVRCTCSTVIVPRLKILSDSYFKVKHLYISIRNKNKTNKFINSKAFNFPKPVILQHLVLKQLSWPWNVKNLRPQTSLLLLRTWAEKRLHKVLWKGILPLWNVQKFPHLCKDEFTPDMTKLLQDFHNLKWGDGNRFHNDL